jgi:hypothetical protein
MNALKHFYQKCSLIQEPSTNLVAIRNKRAALCEYGDIGRKKTRALPDIKQDPSAKQKSYIFHVTLESFPLTKTSNKMTHAGIKMKMC